MTSFDRISAAFARLVRPAAIAATFIAAMASAVIPAAAQLRVPVVRDAEIERLVRDYARPILNAAGLSRAGVEIVLVNDNSFNAFVAGRRIFVNTGALLTSETPNEIIGVLAHEAGHLAGGHQERLRDQISRAQTMAVVAMLLGVGAGVAGALTDSGAMAQAGTGLAMSGTEVARRGLMAYQRTEETTADRSALTYLNATGQSAQGMLKTFERFASTLALTGSRVDPYQVSHPMPRERIANLQTLARESPHFAKVDPPALQQRHDLMRAKIAAYTGGQGAAARIFRNEPRSVAALYGDAISTYLYGSPRNALTKADALVGAQRDNPYFHELRGDILMKANQPSEAAKAYQNAMRLDPANSPVLQVSHAQALLASGSRDSVQAAVRQLRSALDKDRENTVAYRYLAQAYGQLGAVGEAELATAEGHYYSGNIQEARIFAARAQQRLQRGEPAWVRAQDIINQNPQNNQRRN